ncbi:MAG: segregation and condensation protein A, partial [Alphaproteobacteria bacterium]
EAFSVHLPAYDGPLELLLHLIRKEALDIFDIPISRLTAAYLAHLEALRQLAIEPASEFLVMAATLIYLKSRALLPPEEREEIEEEEPLDPEAELVRQLVEHARFKEVAGALAGRPVLGRDVFPRPVAEPTPGEHVVPLRPVTVGELLTALEKLLARRATTAVHRVQGEKLDIRDGLRMVLAYLRLVPRARFDDIFPEDASRMQIVVIFIALLELVKDGAVAAAQDATCGTIEIALVHDVDPERLLEAATGEGVS